MSISDEAREEMEKNLEDIVIGNEFKTVIFNINPIGKPRMVRSDAWSKRKAVAMYWAFKDHLNLLANQNKFKLGHTLNIVFFLAMPDSWSRKKRFEMAGQPHQQKPDIDNLIKAFMDCLTTDDSTVYRVSASKYWDNKGRIEVDL